MLGCLLVACIAVRLFVITHLNVNWDEFYYLSQVHAFMRHELGLRLQTFHVHFFTWLPWASNNEVNQVVAARAVMLALHLGTAALLYRIARRFLARTSALFATVAYLCLSFVIWTAASFRVDPIVIFLVMVALDLILSRKPGRIRLVLAGLSLAAVVLVSIKAAIFTPTLVLLLAVQASQEGVPAVRRGFVIATAAVIAFGLFYAVHGLTLADTGAPSSMQVAGAGLAKTVTSAGLFPRLSVLLVTLRWDAPFWCLWLLGLVVSAKRILGGARAERSRLIELVALALPVASLAVYRNAFSYFYPTILAPASVLVGVGWEQLGGLESRYTRSLLPAVPKILTLTWCTASLLFSGVYLPTVMPLGYQREVLTVLHRMFGRPVPYIDSSSMLASFPQVGFFMTTWGMEAYAQRGEPVLQRAIEEHQPPLLIADHSLLDPEHVVYPATLDFRPPLVDADRDALARTYIHHWGPIYVAGRRLELPVGDAAEQLDLPIGGPYTVEARAPVHIDGRWVSPGQWVELARGPHSITAPEAKAVTLRWGKTLYRPSQEPSQSRLFFMGF